MRSHRVPDFPDPNTSIHQFKAALSPNTLNAQAPAFHRAYMICQRLWPGGVPTTPSHGYNPARAAALLAYARCLRSHGFRSFPDPSRSGELTHEMLTNDGINLHQPGFLEAAETCTSVTHGLLTRVSVTRFAAGQ